MSKPSETDHDARWVVRVYTDESIDPHTYTDVKHIWLKAAGTVLVILQYDEAGHRYVMWSMQRVVWWQVRAAA